MHDDDTSPSMAQLTGAYWLSTPPALRAHKPCPHCTLTSQAQSLPRTVLCRHTHTVMTAVSVLTVAGAVVAGTR